jgi:cytochrome c
VFASEGHVEKPGYAIEVAEETAGGGAAPEAPIDWGTVLPTADVKAGEAVFAKCKSCHTDSNGGPNGTGPNLWGVVGRKPGSHPGFAYSSAMTDFGAKQPIWDYEHIAEFIKAPQKQLPGTKMTFVGLKKPEDRINVIAYLHTQGSSLPIPAPNPAAAAAAPAAESAAAPASATAPAADAAAPAGKGEPTATGSTATPATGSGGPTGSGPAQSNPTSKADAPAAK